MRAEPRRTWRHPFSRVAGSMAMKTLSMSGKRLPLKYQ